MSGTFEDDVPEDRAGLYVLGVLESDEMEAVRRDAARDAGFAALIAQWERRLAPLTLLLSLSAPPSAVWEAIESRIGATVEMRAPLPRGREAGRGRPSRALGYWRAAAVGAMAVAASLAGVLVWRLQPVAAPPAARLAMILPMQQTPGGWLVQVRPDGTLHAIANGNVAHAADRDFELWALADKATRPLPLGLLPVATGAADLHPASLPAEKFKLLVSLEPKGGSTTGLPTGPVMFAGDVVQPPS